MIFKATGNIIIIVCFLHLLLFDGTNRLINESIGLISAINRLMHAIDLFIHKDIRLIHGWGPGGPPLID